MSEVHVIIKNLGLQEYTPVWDAMKKFTLERNKATPDELWLVQHPPVYTLGLNGKESHILNPTNIPVIKIDRGGQITYHGPGQLVVYCMINLERRGYGIKEFVKRLEQSVRDLLNEYHINSHLVNKAPGVYVDNKKIAALGLRVKKHCTYHGLSINIDMDLTPFSHINPCGYPKLAITQMTDYNISDSLETISEKFIPIINKNIYL